MSWRKQIYRRQDSEISTSAGPRASTVRSVTVITEATRSSNINKAATSRRVKKPRGEKVSNNSHDGKDGRDYDPDVSNMFEDEQENPLPNFAADSFVSRSLPTCMKDTRACWYISQCELERIKKQMRVGLCRQGAERIEGRRALGVRVPKTLSDDTLYFHTCCNRLYQTLLSEGFIVLDSVMAGSSAADDMDRVLQHFSSRFSGIGRKTKATDPWLNLSNCTSKTSDRRLAARRSGRMTVLREDIADELEKNNAQIYAAKLRVELALAELMGSLDPEPQTLRFPSTGCRLLLTVGSGKKECPRQDPHVDYDLSNPDGSNYWVPRPDPHFFLLAAGSQGFPLHIWPASHILSNGPPKIVRAVSRGAPSRLVMIPSYSVLIVRGDMFHAGAAGDETNKDRRAPPNVRMHIYAARSGSTISGNDNFNAHCEFR